jgi:hypothetical protein
MTLEQQTDNVLPGLVGFVADRGTRRHLLNFRGGQPPADPPFDLVALLTEVAVGTVVAELETALVVTSNLMRGVRPPLQPGNLEVAEFDPRRTPFTGREHDRHRTVSPPIWRLSIRANGDLSTWL